jgi:hypothetical protein
MKIPSLIDDPAVIRQILEHPGPWTERKGNERGTAPLQGLASDADLVYEPVEDLSSCDYARAGDWPGHDEPTYKYH